MDVYFDESKTLIQISNILQGWMGLNSIIDPVMFFIVFRPRGVQNDSPQNVRFCSNRLGNVQNVGYEQRTSGLNDNNRRGGDNVQFNNNDEEGHGEHDIDIQVLDYFRSNFCAHSSSVAFIHKPEQVGLGVTAGTQVHIAGENSKEIDGKRRKIIFQHYV